MGVALLSLSLAGVLLFRPSFLHNNLINFVVFLRSSISRRATVVFRLTNLRSDRGLCGRKQGTKGAEMKTPNASRKKTTTDCRESGKRTNPHQRGLGKTITDLGAFEN